MIRADTGSLPLTRAGFNGEALWNKAMALLRYARPADGWASVALLALNLMVVVWSVEQADWVPTPNLAALILLAMITGLALARAPVWGLLALPVGLVIGLGVIVWQITSFQAAGMELANVGELWHRLNLWLVAARTGSINIDREPFAFGLMCATWLSGYLAAWVFFRLRNFWGVFVLGGAGLLSNLTFLPAEGSVYLGVYLLTSLLLVARVRAVRRLQEWKRNNFQADSHLGLLSASDSALLSMAVLIIAFALLPTGSFWQPAHNVYEYMRSPLVRFEDDFNRLFAGLPARRPLPYRIWGDVMAFQGTINPTTTPVLQVESPVAMYWKARSYGTYTPKGWISEDTVLQPTDWTPSHSFYQPYKKRFEVTHSLTVNYDTRNLFAGGQVSDVSQDARIETYDSPIYRVDLSQPATPGRTYPGLDRAVLNLKQAVRQNGPAVSRVQLSQAAPQGFALVDVRRENNLVQEATLAELLPEQPDTLSLRTAGRELKKGQTYEVTSSVSSATGQDLRRAGLDYPTWALARYTQLPPELPQRIRDLSDEITAGAETPYDKAKAIESHLKTYAYSLTIEPPPYNADGVDHFLFEERRGYSEYFASAMTVLLRAQGIPARMVTGYTAGDRVPNHDVYVVTDSHSHGWSEVYFPGYGWIGFEPTPGASMPVAVKPVAEELDFVFTALPEDSDVPLCEFEDEEGCEEDFFGDGTALSPQEPSALRLLQEYLPWISGGLAVILLAGGVMWGFWRRYLASSTDPAATFRHLAFLGRLNAAGPVGYQTPYQYLGRLQEVLPAHQDSLSIIVVSYVRSLYGRKEATPAEAERLTQAWLAVRMPLLLNLFRRRNHADDQV